MRRIATFIGLIVLSFVVAGSMPMGLSVENSFANQKPNQEDDNNRNKDDKCPWQIINKLRPKMNLEIARLPPAMLDWLGPD